MKKYLLFSSTFLYLAFSGFSKADIIIAKFIDAEAGRIFEWRLDDLEFGKIQIFDPAKESVGLSVKDVIKIAYESNNIKDRALEVKFTHLIFGQALGREDGRFFYIVSFDYTEKNGNESCFKVVVLPDGAVVQPKVFLYKDDNPPLEWDAGK